MWPQRWTGSLYSTLYAQLGRGTFTLSQVSGLVGSDAKARVAVSRLKAFGLIYVFSVNERRKQYILGDPILLPYLATGRLGNLHAVKQGRYARLVGVFSAEAIEAFTAIRSVTVYGSVSRATANEESDVDLLVLMDSNQSVGERIQQLSQVEDSGRTRAELDWLDAHGVHTHISILPLTGEEVSHFPPVLLDVIEDGITIVDDGTFSEIRDRLRAQLVESAAKRVFLSPNEWYWDLAPRILAGEAHAS